MVQYWCSKPPALGRGHHFSNTVLGPQRPNTVPSGCSFSVDMDISHHVPWCIKCSISMCIFPTRVWGPEEHEESQSLVEMGSWVDGWMSEWMNGWMDGFIYLFFRKIRQVVRRTDETSAVGNALRLMPVIFGKKEREIGCLLLLLHLVARRCDTQSCCSNLETMRKHLSACCA